MDTWGSLYPSVHLLGFPFLFAVFSHALWHVAS